MSTVKLQGVVTSGFEPVRETFAANFALQEAYREVGASLAVYRRGECVVDLWAGYADRARTRPWGRDTLVNVWSTTKGIAAMCVALLVERGALNYDDRIADFWPEFAAAGKDEVTVAHVLSHEAGLPGFIESTSIDNLLDQELCAARLAAQAPLWKPGTANGYHAATWGVLVAEIVRRVSGRSISRLLAEELAGPLEADFFIGLPGPLESRVADVIPPDHPVDMGGIEMNAAMRLALTSPTLDPTRANSRDWRAAELPAMNGHGSARGIARLYAATIARMGPTKFLSARTLAVMTRPMADRPDLVLGFNPQWSMGFVRNAGGMLGPHPDTFGHGGWGGSFGCAHAATGIAIGYAPNHMGAELVGDPRATAICRAVFECAG